MFSKRSPYRAGSRDLGRLFHPRHRPPPCGPERDERCAAPGRRWPIHGPSHRSISSLGSTAARGHSGCLSMLSACLTLRLRGGPGHSTTTTTSGRNGRGTAPGHRRRRCVPHPREMESIKIHLEEHLCASTRGAPRSTPPCYGGCHFVKGDGIFSALCENRRHSSMLSFWMGVLCCTCCAVRGGLYQKAMSRGPEIYAVSLLENAGWRIT